MMLELLHKKSNALQAVYERNKILAKYLAEDDTTEALKQLAYCNQLIGELSDIEEKLQQAEARQPRQLTPQKERQERMERAMQKAILDKLQHLMEQNVKVLHEKTEEARQGVKNIRTKRDGVKAYALGQDEYSGAHLDASR